MRKGLGARQRARLACGIGYGANILLDNPAVTDYVGVDVAEYAIAEAQRAAPAHARFIIGSALDLRFDHAAFDAIVSLETLEHLEDPPHAVAEFRRVVKPQGVPVGSVPTASFGDFCTAQYGKNQYHLQKFGAPGAEAAIGSGFSRMSSCSPRGSASPRPCLMEPAEKGPSIMKWWRRPRAGARLRQLSFRCSACSPAAGLSSSDGCVTASESRFPHKMQL
jgi:SAM-dependent methyltransferase